MVTSTSDDAEKALKGVKKIEDRVVNITYADTKKSVSEGKEKTSEKNQQKPTKSSKWFVLM